MGKRIHLDRIEQLFEKSPVVDIRSIKRIIKLHSKNTAYAKLVIHNLLKKNKIQKIAKGYYTKYNDNSLAVLCYNHAYLGLQTALSYHQLWDQETIPVILTPQKIRQGIRTVAGGNVMFRNIQKKYCFGFDYYQDGMFYLPYSDIEKTFIDLVLFKQPISKELLKIFRKKVDKKRVITYLKVYPENIRRKVLKLI